MSANPYAQGWREWDERYAALVLGKRNWQIAAGRLLLATIILAAGMVLLSSRTRYIVYAVKLTSSVTRSRRRNRLERRRHPM